jgi:rhodanese-related sulfurtransferase
MLSLRRVMGLLWAAALGAAVSNLVASPTRRLPWIGQYPNALVVPAGAAASVPRPAPTTTPSAVAPEAASASKDYPPHPDRPWADITGEEAVALHGRGVTFLDARRTSVYNEGHVAGARSLPIWESTVDDGIKRLFEEGYDLNAPLVVYCSGGDCEDSHMLAQRLHGYGFNNALVYTGGFPDWEKRGMPIERGTPH